ncbi:MAG: PAS domain-containing protein [Sideroxydans sp.]|nr:PAS domain-containing protein [Sideroxydans sp.]
MNTPFKFSLQFDDDCVLVQQLLALLSHAHNFVFSAVLISLLMWLSAVTEQNAPVFMWWWAMVLLSSLIGFFQAQHYLKLGIELAQARRVARQFVVMRGVDGLLWAMLPWLTMDSSSLTSSILVVSVMAAIVGGAPSLLSPVLPVYMAFGIPVALGMASKFWLIGMTTFDYLAMATILYLLTMLGVARNNARTIRASIDLRLQLMGSLERLRESEEFLREAQLIAGLGSYVLDIQTGRWQGSDAIFQMHGIDKSYETTLTALAQLDHPDDNQLMQTYLEQSIANKSGVFDISYRIIRYDNQQVRWLRALGRMSFDTAGQPHKLFSTLQDISEHRQREAELAESGRRLRDIEQRQTLSQERQRLMQDMHDGLGSSLVSALRVVEYGQMDEVAVAEVLKGCIDDLKLAIDSMETAEPDLLLLLATFRFRLEPRLESTGIRLKWEVQDIPALLWLDPKNALHIMRILQESFTNIIKHSNASEIRVATSVVGERVLVSILDNGQGFVVSAALQRGGKGLSNQVRRAEAIGGAVDWQSTSNGTNFMMYLPIQLAGN